jgi:hypothetical protein
MGICGYLKRFKNGSIRVRVDKPDMNPYPIVEHNWLHSVQGDVQEIIPKDIPTPLGKSVLLTHYADANLHHDIVCRLEVTGVLHFINGTPIEWYSKRQG